MATADFRFIVNHTSAGKVLGNWPMESILARVTVDAEGRPVASSVNSVFSSHGRLRGDGLHVHSYVALDHDQDVSVNLLT